MQAQNPRNNPRAMHIRSRSPENRVPYQPPLKRVRHRRWCDVFEQRSLANGTEENAHRVAQRQKQIDYGKNTIAYDRFNADCPRYSRRRGDPMTPLARQKCSKRSFAGQITSWKKRVYAYVATLDAKQKASVSAKKNTSGSGTDDPVQVKPEKTAEYEQKREAESSAARMEIVEQPPSGLGEGEGEEEDFSDLDDIELDDYGNVVEQEQTHSSPHQPNPEPNKSDESLAPIFADF